MNKTFDQPFFRSTLSGIYQLSGDLLNTQNRAQSEGLAIFTTNLGSMQGKTNLLNHIARLLQFPEYFDANWDALHECLTDLTWLNFTGMVLLFEQSKFFYEHYPDDFEMMIHTLTAVTDHWRNKNIPFFVLIHDANNSHSGLPLWPSIPT